MSYWHLTETLNEKLGANAMQFATGVHIRVPLEILYRFIKSLINSCKFIRNHYFDQQFYSYSTYTRPAP